MSNEHLEITDELLDRLVDGELRKDEYRRLLVALDAQPDGWRRCATAFLETQVWDRELRAVQCEFVKVPGPVLTKSNRQAKASWLPLTLSIAASFLVAFGLGVWWRNGAAAIRATAAPVTSVPQVEEVASSGSVESEPRLGHSSAESVPEELVTLVVDRGDGAQEQFAVPVYDANDTIARQWLEQRLSLPSQLEQRLLQSGFEVQIQREWTPLDLRDGRRVLFPVDQLEITPVKEIVLQ